MGDNARGWLLQSTTPSETSNHKKAILPLPKSNIVGCSHFDMFLEVAYLAEQLIAVEAYQSGSRSYD